MEERIPQFNIESIPFFDGHEFVSAFYDESSDLRGFFAIHNTNLGPAIGGTRMVQYESDSQALEDALLISRAMTYKCALAGVNFGGGKAVIVGHPESDKTDELLHAFANKMNYLSGTFIAGTDVGITLQDLSVMGEETDAIAGLPDPRINKYETPHVAARGIIKAMQAALEFKYGDDRLAGKRVGVKGVGQVGSELVTLLFDHGAEVTIADINDEQVRLVKKHHPRIRVVADADIHSEEFDIYAPCALGGDFDEVSIQNLRSDIICGSANNQLAYPEIGDSLYAMGILYTPDYVVNAGGLINVADDFEADGYSHERVNRRVEKIRETLSKILARSREEKRAPHRIADQMAEEIFYED